MLEERSGAYQASVVIIVSRFTLNFYLFITFDYSSAIVTDCAGVSFRSSNTFIL